MPPIADFDLGELARIAQRRKGAIGEDRAEIEIGAVQSDHDRCSDAGPIARTAAMVRALSVMFICQALLRRFTVASISCPARLAPFQKSSESAGRSL